MLSGPVGAEVGGLRKRSPTPEGCDSFRESLYSEPAHPEPREGRARLRNLLLPGSLWDKAVGEEHGSFARRPLSGAAEKGLRVCFARWRSRLHPEQDRSDGKLILTQLAGYINNKIALASRSSPSLEAFHGGVRLLVTTLGQAGSCQARKPELIGAT